MNEVFQLVYVSKAAQDISYTDIMNILAVSRENNEREGITGILIFRDGNFLQILEGSQNAVHGVLMAIRQDERNHSLQVVSESLSDRRLFDNWSMAFFDADITTPSSKYLNEIFDIIQEASPDKNHLILDLFKKFQASSPDLK